MNDQQFRQAQVAYDNQEPPDDEGCRHVWRRIPGQEDSDTDFYKCLKCKTVSEL